MTLQPLTSEAIAPEFASEIDYPDNDGNPMADNTEQYRWIVMLKENLEIMYADDPNVFVAGDLLWYPVRYSAKCTAPDVMVVLGRPKGRRGSYKQWLESDIAPQVAFEILSPSNKDRRGINSLEEKFEFYETYGIQEYYIYDPDAFILEGWQKQGDRFVKIASMLDWVSPLLGIRFNWELGKELIVFRPDGQSFLSSVELDRRLQRAEQRADRLAERLRALGIDPDRDV